jgi:hypothetical protein
MSSQSDREIRNPADWMLQQFLEVWSVTHGLPYDIFEVPPAVDVARNERLKAELKKYPMIVSTVPYEGAMVIGAGTEGKKVNPLTAGRVRSLFERDLKSRGWIK